MARGQIAKAEIVKKILSNFEGSFLYNDGKEIRIPIQENGEDIQIKVTLTAAKENVVSGGENVLPGEVETNSTVEFKDSHFENKTDIIMPTEQEKQNVSDLLRALGL